MKKLYIIYNTSTGRFKQLPMGIVDDSQPQDGSTLFERIPSMIAKRPGHDVVYLDKQDLPNPLTKKINVPIADALIDLTTQELADDQAEINREASSANLVSRDVELFRMVIAIWEIGVSKGLWTANDLPINIKNMAIELKQKLTEIDT